MSGEWENHQLKKKRKRKKYSSLTPVKKVFPVVIFNYNPNTPLSSLSPLLSQSLSLFSPHLSSLSPLYLSPLLSILSLPFSSLSLISHLFHLSFLSCVTSPFFLSTARLLSSNFFTLSFEFKYLDITIHKY